MIGMRLGTLVIGAAVAALAAGSANAADMPVKAPLYKAPPVVGCGYNAITAANNQISVDYAGTNVDYLERIPDGTPLDSEKGWVSGVSVTGSGMFNVGTVCNVYLFARGTYFDGKTDYWQDGPTGQSRARIWEGDFRLGKGFDLAPNWMLTPYIGGGLRNWGRDVCQAGGACVAGGYDETYRHDYLGGGLMLQYAATSRMVLTASGLVGSTFDAHISGGPSPTGAPTVIPFGAALGSSVIYKVEGSVDYAFTPNLHGNVGVEYTNFKYGASQLFVFDTGGGLANEPDSRTQTVTVRAGLGWSWGAAPVVAKY